MNLRGFFSHSLVSLLSCQEPRIYPASTKQPECFLSIVPIDSLFTCLLTWSSTGKKIKLQHRGSEMPLTWCLFFLTLFFNLTFTNIGQGDRFMTFRTVIHSILETERTLCTSIWHFTLDLLSIYCPLTGSKLLNLGIDRWHNFPSTKDRYRATK